MQDFDESGFPTQSWGAKQKKGGWDFTGGEETGIPLVLFFEQKRNRWGTKKQKEGEIPHDFVVLGGDLHGELGSYYLSWNSTTSYLI